MKVLLQNVEWLFRHCFVYPWLRLLLRNARRDLPLDIRRVKKLLIFRHDRIGDMIVSTPIFRMLKEANPELILGVIASPLNCEIIKANPHVDRIHILENNWLQSWRELLVMRRERYDVVVNFIFNRTTTMGLLANFISPRGTKIGQGDPKYQFYFNSLVSLNANSAFMVETLSTYMQQVFAIDRFDESARYEIAIDKSARRNVNAFVERHSLVGKQYVVVNLSATEQERKMSKPQLLALATHLAREKNLPTVLVASPAEDVAKSEIVEAVGSPLCSGFPESGIAGLTELAALIEGASCVFTPDTSIIHFASAMNTPVVGFFSGTQLTTWFPYRVRHMNVLAESGLPVARIPHDIIIRRADEFLKEIFATEARL